MLALWSVTFRFSFFVPRTVIAALGLGASISTLPVVLPERSSLSVTTRLIVRVFPTSDSGYQVNPYFPVTSSTAGPVP
ncbi:hypothetical protein D3C71_2026740 [compost metagenome]